ncbi:hypothetical protein [Larkinella rosea]|uniref:Uncharacterized protein n=1 Tax=Larkinella rosea TaxID=2025312 RepID=A0A3P1BFS7_9BACT|nr:hypothetical protein [Larkinella rosea]RRA99771.1 hypothetical protein EHT25_24370 [Larkinella rosea]
MRTIEVNILADDDEEFVMNILNALAQKRIIEINLHKDVIRPGKPMTTGELNRLIDESELSRSYSVEEAKAMLGL